MGNPLAGTASCDISKTAELKFVVLLGTVSLFADVTYEGARSITGPFMAILGASATVVGVVAGFGELSGYALRLVSGYLADRTGRYWTIVFLGYAINLLAVPLLALVGHWEMAAVLMVAERMGKAVRTPARDVMLSCAAEPIGRGWSFGLHEALDQIGAVCGPLLVAAVFYFNEILLRIYFGRRFFGGGLSTASGSNSAEWADVSIQSSKKIARLRPWLLA